MKRLTLLLLIIAIPSWYQSSAVVWERKRETVACVYL
jgi:hypothetical protein